jgi:hypothetical protein
VANVPGDRLEACPHCAEEKAGQQRGKGETHLGQGTPLVAEAMAVRLNAVGVGFPPG